MVNPMATHYYKKNHILKELYISRPKSLFSYHFSLFFSSLEEIKLEEKEGLESRA